MVQVCKITQQIFALTKNSKAFRNTTTNKIDKETKGSKI